MTRNANAHEGQHRLTGTADDAATHASTATVFSGKDPDIPATSG